MFDYNDPKHEVQEWMIAYVKNNSWKTINLPSDISKNIIERILLDLNKRHDIIFARRIMGVFEEGKNNFFKKGDFIGI